MRYFNFLIFHFYLGALLSAQPQPLYFHELTVEDGLSQTNNRYIFQDSRGLIWASSQDGVNCFDGRKVKVWKPDPRDTVGMAGSNVQGNFFEDRAGNIWFATFDALNCYSRYEDKVFNLRDTLENGESFVGYYAIHLDTAQLLWLIEHQQTLRFFDTRSKRFLPDRYELMPGIQKAHALTDARGQKIVLSYRYNETGLCVTTLLNGRGMQQKWLLNGAQKHLDEYIVSCLAESDTLVWVAHFRGFGSLNLQTGDYIPYFQKPEGTDLYPRDICSLDSTRLLAAFGQGGILLFDKENLAFTERYVYRPYQPHAAPMDAQNIFRFERGDVFVNSVDQGISFANLHKSKFVTLLGNDPGRKNAAPIKVRALAEDGVHNVWCLTMDDQLIQLNPLKEVIAWHLPNPARADALPKISGRYLFIDSKDRVWVLTWKGLWMLAPGQHSFRQLSNQIFLHGLTLHGGRIILTAYTGGIYEVKEMNNKISFEKIKTIDDTKAYTTLYQGESGLLYACRELSSVAVFDTRQHFKELASLPIQGEINAWYEPSYSDVLWIATGYGLVKWNKATRTMELFNEKTGLPDQNIYAVLPDDLGILWLSSNRGIIRFNPHDSSAHAFTMADGLPALEFKALAWLKKDDGELWFGSTNGIAVFHPGNIHYLPPPARVLLTEILVNDQKPIGLVCAHTGAINPMEMRRLELTFNKNTLSFEFAAPEYADPSHVRYRYRLEGYDKNWVELSNRGFARFANLPPGEYVLLLLASNSDGVWMNKNEPTRLEIEISPPIWLRWWFILLCTVIFIGTTLYAITLYYRRREHILRLKADKDLAVEKERLRISRDLHDDLGSGLGAIGLLSDIALSKTDSAEMIAEVGKIADSAHDLSAKVREIIWAANAQNDTLDKSAHYLHQYAVVLFEGTGIELLAHLPTDIPAITISGDHRRALFLAFKEALHNVVKHARATQVVIDISLMEKQLGVLIRDNGCGFIPATLNDSGNGLLNMRRRLEEIGGQFRFESGGEGTSVSFILPL